MQGDVERVARAMAAAKGLDWDGKAKATEYANHGYWLPIARAALAATREIDAEAMSNTLLPATWNRHDCADWLQQRANDVKEATNE